MYGFVEKEISSFGRTNIPVKLSNIYSPILAFEYCISSNNQYLESLLVTKLYYKPNFIIQG